MDENKVKVINEWPMPKSMGEVCSFHGLKSLYRRCIRDFSTIVEPLPEVIKQHLGFKWGDIQEKAFNKLKDKLISIPLLSLPNFANTFKIK